MVRLQTGNIVTTTNAGSGKRRWYDVAGGWLAIGTSPGALILGAVIAERHGGPMPLLSLLLSLSLMWAILWFQGIIGLKPPIGEGANLTQLTPRYFDRTMQRVLGGVIALGMLGWFGFNVGLGGTALGALLHLPHWVGVLAIGLPVLLLSLGGLRSWNGLAALATASVLILTGLVVFRLAAPASPVTFAVGRPLDMVADVAVMVGYISVFSVRSPDFTANLASRRDLAFSVLMLCVPLVLIAMAGIGLQRGTGSSDLVGVLAQPGGLAIGNLLIALSVIGPTFTTLYSGAPALKAAIGTPERTGMVVVTGIGLALAAARFDLWLGPWLAVLGAMLPPLVIPLAVEAARRRRGYARRQVPLLVWAPGSLIAVILTLSGQRISLLVGLGLAALGTGLWYFFAEKAKREV